jgi:pyridoxamine 5'-phosphate oxidase
MDLPDSGRSEYSSGKLGLADLDASPYDLLRKWLAEATESTKVIEPNAMTLATVDGNGRPSARVVLLRGLDVGLVFYTNYLSRKGSDFSENDHAAVCFWWSALERQVRVEGRVVRVSEAESDQYFASRPRESQAASATSLQSQIIADRKALESDMKELLEREPIERPDHWGGYRLTPDYFEFWQGRKARLHDRFCYVSQGDGWVIHRLAP